MSGLAQRKKYGNLVYVAIRELPKDQQIPFLDWLEGTKIPMIPNEEMCAYWYDYEKWHTYWKEGLNAPKYD